ncbi:DNA-binding MarR family transcriptional regulator [Kitasatospora sp. MAP12-15]|uniref:MarR family winged helix-turn-helix transcriptional regulator n=1 Tax=unclassified Kitasatospora TaxID=2633591 RepID=UPI0024735143|nr:MarR family transcriptional regulator [Kitasatospora sp. MAP12-44]MDH6108562.1 DNA-binding MarR family transcriptional regulator [Kitasatospora sp. MAP12-44]
MEDAVADVLRQWERAYPGLDTGPIAVIGRINRCAALLQQSSSGLLGAEGLTRPEFDILGALRRADHELTPTQLARESFASGAAVTKRLRLLEKRGLIARRTDERDRRVTHLSLTASGRELVDRLIPVMIANDRALLAGLTAEQNNELARALGHLLLTLEGSIGRMP